MKIAVICGYLDSLKPLAVHTVDENKVEYCQRHGYTLLVPRRVNQPFVDAKSHAGGFSWSRMAFLLNILETGLYDWVWTVGADTLVTNMTKPLEEVIAMATESSSIRTRTPNRPPDCSWAPARVIKTYSNFPRTGIRHLLICGERVTPIQADSFIMRSSKESADYLNDILSHWQLYKHHPWVENQTMIDLFDRWAHLTFIVPQWRMNAYDYKRFYHLNPCYRDNTDCFGHRGQWQPGDFLIHWPASNLQERLQFLKEYQPQIIR